MTAQKPSRNTDGIVTACLMLLSMIFGIAGGNLAGQSVGEKTVVDEFRYAAHTVCAKPAYLSPGTSQHEAAMFQCEGVRDAASIMSKAALQREVGL